VTTKSLGAEDSPMVGMVVLSGSAGQSDKRLGETLHNFAQLQLVQDGGLSGSIKTHHQDSHLFLSP
jgi:hypothetical protein